VDRKLNPNFSLFESLNDKKSLSKTKYDAIMHLNKNKNKNVIQPVNYFANNSRLAEYQPAQWITFNGFAR